MEYPPAVRRLLDAAKADLGDTVAVMARGDRLVGVVMPHHAFSGPDILTLKLGSGYNVGIDVKDIAKVELVAKHVPAVKKAVVVPRSGKLPVLSVLGTGGTIASYVDYRTGAVHPAVTAEELVSSVPELSDLADVRARGPGGGRRRGGGEGGGHVLPRPAGDEGREDAPPAGGCVPVPDRLARGEGPLRGRKGAARGGRGGGEGTHGRGPPPRHGRRD